MGWREAIVEIAVRSPDRETRDKAAHVLIHPPLFYSQGMVDPADLEHGPFSLTVPVYGKPSESVAVGLTDPSEIKV